MSAASEPARVAGALNFRDTGGLPADRGRTRTGVLFRSGNLAGLTGEGRADLAGLRVRRIVDLRADEEIAAEPSLVTGLDLDTVHAPLFLGSAASFFIEDITLPDMYRALVDGAADRLVLIARSVIERHPVLVHCTVGKDRTGVAVAILLAAVGVDKEAIVADYARTEHLLPPERNARVVAFLRALHPDARHLEQLATRSPAPVMRELLTGVDERFGSAADYLRAHGLRTDELDALAGILIDGSPT
ncbi:tyrosine-protein phosphatase [Microbacterium dextranolyticum]|uniref:Protein-tyrosine-phosphatase n=1 Tax=Microbacterium dextranolyticum TaxID=36806 RepID=A0A9W6M6I1_9MICO|nr:tyrosine-protein phosphatase [Microbacterium dextranolyticum]MBM7463675.1 protein-tyrosine phosphatase [Microbacterium dextranolyticum]GLJ96494.1 protein-tyrosine-phosphatase [Microbacterium dextranolyticum]